MSEDEISITCYDCYSGMDIVKKPNRKRSTLEDEDERVFEQETFNQDYKNDTT